MKKKKKMRPARQHLVCLFAIERSNDENIKIQKVRERKLYVLNQNKQVVDIEKYLHNICVYVNI